MHCFVHVTAWIQPFYSWTTVLSLSWLLLRCMPACARGWCCCMERGPCWAAFGAAPLGQWSRSACSGKPAWMWKHAPTCPTENPSTKMEGAFFWVSLSTSHIFSPLTQRWASNDITARQKTLFNITPEVFPLPLPLTSYLLSEDQLYVCAPL